MAEEKKTILVIEDDFLSMKLVVDLLGMNGFNTLSCNDGYSALETLKDTIPDFILLDINIPKMNGYEVYKKIRDDDRLDRVKVIALSASVMKEDEEKIRKAGFDDFIPKPIDTKALVNKIKGYLSA